MKAVFVITLSSPDDDFIFDFRVLPFQIDKRNFHLTFSTSCWAPLLAMDRSIASRTATTSVPAHPFDSVPSSPRIRDKKASHSARKGLPGCHMRDEHLTLADLGPEPRESVGDLRGRTDHALVIEPQRLVEVHVVDCEHSLGADDRDQTALTRVQPGSLDVDHVCHRGI